MFFNGFYVFNKISGYGAEVDRGNLKFALFNQSEKFFQRAAIFFGFNFVHTLNIKK